MSIGVAGERPESMPATMVALPSEVLKRVLRLAAGEDVLRLGATCRALRAVAADEAFWEERCRARWFFFALPEATTSGRGAGRPRGARALTWRQVFFAAQLQAHLDWEAARPTHGCARQPVAAALPDSPQSATSMRASACSPAQPRAAPPRVPSVWRLHEAQDALACVSPHHPPGLPVVITTLSVSGGASDPAVLASGRIVQHPGYDPWGFASPTFVYCWRRPDGPGTPLRHTARLELDVSVACACAVSESRLAVATESGEVRWHRCGGGDHKDVRGRQSPSYDVPEHTVQLPDGTVGPSSSMNVVDMAPSTHGDTLWLLSRGGNGVVAVDPARGHPTRITEAIEGYRLVGMCSYPPNDNVAIAVGRCWPSICARCYTGGALMREDLHELGMMLCEHRHSRHGGASLTLVDKRQARLTDRFSLLHQGVHPHITTSAKREHYVFTSHNRKSLCAWDLRCMAFPVHEEFVHEGTTPGSMHRRSNPLFLSANEDVAYGQSTYGEIWAWDLSESLGWARDPAQRGCWLKYRSRSDAESGGWRWPVLVHRAEQDHSSHGGPILAALPGCPDAGVVSLRTTALGGTLTLDESGEINNLSDTVTLWSLAAQSERGSA